MLVLLLGSGNGLRHAVEGKFKDDATNSIWVFRGRTSVPYRGHRPGRQIQLSLRDYDTVRHNVDDVEHISGRFRMRGNFSVRYGEKTSAFSVVGAHPDHRVPHNREYSAIGRFVRNSTSSRVGNLSWRNRNEMLRRAYQELKPGAVAVSPRVYEFFAWTVGDLRMNQSPVWGAHPLRWRVRPVRNCASGCDSAFISSAFPGGLVHAQRCGMRLPPPTLSLCLLVFGCTQFVTDEVSPVTYDVSLSSSQQVSMDQARELMRTGVDGLIRDASLLFGTAFVQQRLRDLAANSPHRDGQIHVYFAPGQHPHNVLVGIPYGAMLISEVPGGFQEANDTAGIRRVSAHEFGHLLFGKFNEAFAEPVANLLIPSPGTPEPGNPSTRSFAEVFALAVLELRAEQPGLYPEWSLDALFRYRPSANAGTCGLFGETGDVEDTRAFVEWMFQSEYDAYYAPLLEGRQPSQQGPGAAPQPHWARWRALASPHNGNYTPNEAGAARDILAFTGDVLMYYLIEQGGVERFLRFYLRSNPATLRELYGIADFAALEAALLATLQAKYRPLLVGDAATQWSALKTAIQNDPCYGIARWPDTQCRGDVALDAAQNVMRAFGPQGPGGPGGAPAPRLHPRVEQELANPGAGVSIVDGLGQNYDLARYCDAGHWSGAPAAPPEALRYF